MLTSSIWMPVTDDQLRDMGRLPPLPPLPPDPRLTRWRRSLQRRYWGLRWRLAEIIAGQHLIEGCWECDE